MLTALRGKHARFVKEFLIDQNGKRAAIRAGYSKKTAEVQASRLLRNAKVAAAVAEGRKAALDKLDISLNDIARELHKCGFANMQDYLRVGPDGDPVLDWSKLTRDQAAALAEVTVDRYMDGGGDDAREVKRVKFRLVDKRGALVDLAKLLGFWQEKHQHDVKHSWDAVLAQLDEEMADGRR